MERTDAEAIEKILAKFTPLDEVLEVLIRGRDQPQIDFNSPDAAQRLDHAVFQHTQQLYLRGSTHFTDLVQEEGPAMGQKKPSGFGLFRIRKGALFVAKQLRFEQVFRDGCTIDRDERAPCSWTRIVDGSGQQFLAGPALSRNQDRRIRYGNVSRQSLHRGELRRCTDDLVESELFAEALAQAEVFESQPAHVQRPLDHDLQLIIVDRLTDVVERPLFRRLNRRFHRPESGDDDNWHTGRLFGDVLKDIQAADFSHLPIRQHKVNSALVRKPQAGFSRLRQYQAVAFGPQHEIYE